MCVCDDVLLRILWFGKNASQDTSPVVGKILHRELEDMLVATKALYAIAIKLYSCSSLP